MTILILLGTLIICLLVRVPIGISLGVSTILSVLYSETTSFRFVIQSLTTSLDSFPLIAVPLFILAGELMGRGGISKRLFNVGNSFLGHVTGSTAIITIATCMVFAAISGSGPATVAAIGGLVIPEMLNRGYDKKFACGVVATAGSIGVIIPPSIPMIIYSVSTGTSTSKIFIAGILPGLLIGFILIAYSYLYAKKNNLLGNSQKTTSRERLKAFIDAKWSILMPFIVLGGIYGGIFTPTEAAGVAVIYGFIIGKFVYKDLSWKDIYQVLAGSALTTASIMVIIGTATGFGKILTIEQVPQKLAALLTSVSSSPFVVILLIVILLLVVGCIMETLAAIIILAPILLPIATGVGVDPVHFGIIMVVTLAIGFVTPPLGVNLFVTCKIGNISMVQMSKTILPWLVVLCIPLLLIVFIPEISLLLNNILN